MAIHTVEFDDERDCFKCATTDHCVLVSRLLYGDNLPEGAWMRCFNLLGEGEAPLRGKKKIHLSIMMAHLCSKFEPKKDKNAI